MLCGLDRPIDTESTHAYASQHAFRSPLEHACSSPPAISERVASRVAHPKPSPPCDIMAPRKGETDEDRITRMYQNASQAISKAQMKQMLAALKEHPQHIPTVHRQLTTLGAIKGGKTTAACAAASPGKSGACPAIEDGCVDTPVKDNIPCDDELQGSSGGTEEKPLYAFDKNTTRVEQLPATYLEAALTALEPAFLSKANLRNIMKKGCRDYNQKLLLRYWEFATGMAPSMPLTVNGTKSWDAFVSHGRQQNMMRQRRLSDLVLPVDFYSDGVYHIDLATRGCLTITRKKRGRHPEGAVQRSDSRSSSR